MKKIISAYRKLSYRKKVFAGMILAAALPIILCFAGVVLSFNISNERKLVDESEQILVGVESDFTKEVAGVKQSIGRIANSPATVRMLEKNEIDDVYTVYRMMYLESRNMGTSAEYILYDRDGNMKLYTGEMTPDKDTLSVNWGILYELIHNDSDVEIRSARMYGTYHKEILLRIGTKIVDEDGTIKGFVIAQIKQDFINELVRGYILNTGGAVYMMDEFDECFFASSAVPDNDFDKALLALQAGAKIKYYTNDSKTYRYYYTHSDTDNIHILYKQPIKAYYSMTRSLLLILLFAFLLGIILCLATSRNLSRMFYKPIRRMSDGMEEIKKGNYDIRITIDSEDEMGHLSEMFNSMSEKLTDNMEELVNREKELSEANIKMMQAQLNPHFIYNTLDTMKWIGKDNDIHEVATISSGLADIMRASISSGQTVKLEKEIALIESYAAIQQIRFNDKFELLTDIEPEFLECEVPKLILQPIVENAIIHGFNNRDYGQVLISAHREDDKLIILVQDDGEGIDEETMNKLNNHEQLAKGTNIGFHNVDSIIRLHYGNEYGLVVSKNQTRGTLVTYTLPYKCLT